MVQHYLTLQKSSNHMQKELRVYLSIPICHARTPPPSFTFEITWMPYLIQGDILNLSTWNPVHATSEDIQYAHSSVNVINTINLNCVPDKYHTGLIYGPYQMFNSHPCSLQSLVGYTVLVNVYFHYLSKCQCHTRYTWHSVTLLVRGLKGHNAKSETMLLKPRSLLTTNKAWSFS